MDQKFDDTTLGRVLKGVSKLPDLKNAHYVDIRIRKNGETAIFEGDWLKDLQKLYKS